LVFQLLGEGRITGLRIDHPDGLKDPNQYFQRLQDSFAKFQKWHAGSGASQGRCLYLVAEKILSPGEQLPADWPVAGTTGYDFLNQTMAVFVNSTNLPGLDEVYFEVTKARVNFDCIVSAGKKKILQTTM